MTAIMFVNMPTALRRMLDAFVSAWMRQAAAAAGHARQRPGLAPDQPATAATPFQPLDPGIVNASIPAFFIGRKKEGFWLARDVKGQIGGIFLLESSALAFAGRNSRPSGCATIFPSERFELDLENQVIR